jgi:hypothetical protein
MSLPDNQDLLGQRIKVLQIILGSLIAGSLFMIGFALVQRGLGNGPAAPDVPLLTYISLVWAFAAVVAFVLVPDRAVSSGRLVFARNPKSSAGGVAGDTAHLTGLLQTRKIIGAALLEGAAIFLAIAYMLEGEVGTIITAGILVLVMVWQIPTRNSAESWIEEQRLLLEQERTTSG